MKLSVQHKRDLVNEVIEARTKEAKEALRKRRQKLGDRIYDHLLGKHQKAMHSLPQWCFVQSHEVPLLRRYGGLEHRDRVEMSKAELMPPHHMMCYEPFSDDHEMVVEWDGIRMEENRISRLTGEAFDQLHAFLKPVKSLGKLIAAWPDVKKEAPKTCAAVEADARQLPTVQFESVDAILNSFNKAA
jgi:hypothetical protein